MTHLWFFSKITSKSLIFLLFIDILKITYFPDLNLILLSGGFLILDLISGVLKSLTKGDFLYSEGLRKTIMKLTQYLGIVVLLFLATNVFTYDPKATQRALTFFGASSKDYGNIAGSATALNNWVLLMIMYTEALSVCENLIVIDPKSAFSRALLKPVHSILSLAFLSNPLKKFSELISTKNNNTKNP